MITRLINRVACAAVLAPCVTACLAAAVGSASPAAAHAEGASRAPLN